MLRPPPGTSHVVLDTPGALYGLDLAKVLIRLDALVVPVGPSVFDRDASLDFLKELNRLPRVATGKCKVAVVGMRWSMERTQRWFETREWDVPLVTVLPDSVNYRNYLEQGCTLFDQVDALNHPHMQYWQPLLLWLDGIGVSRHRSQANGQDALSSEEDLTAELPAYLKKDNRFEVSSKTRLLKPQPLAGTAANTAPAVMAPVSSPALSLPSESATALTSAKDDTPPQSTPPAPAEPSSPNGSWSSRWRRMFG